MLGLIIYSINVHLICFIFSRQNLLSISQHLLNNKSGDFQVEDNLLKMFRIKDWMNLTIYQMINDVILWGNSTSENCLNFEQFIEIKK